MNINILKIYINKLNKEDINNFLSKRDILVNNNELDYLYSIIKSDYEKIFNNDEKIFNNIKNNINSDAYNKLLDLLNKYKEMYQKKELII